METVYEIDKNQVSSKNNWNIHITADETYIEKKNEVKHDPLSRKIVLVNSKKLKIRQSIFNHLSMHIRDETDLSELLEKFNLKVRV